MNKVKNNILGHVYGSITFKEGTNSVGRLEWPHLKSLFGKSIENCLVTKILYVNQSCHPMNECHLLICYKHSNINMFLNFRCL